MQIELFTKEKKTMSAFTNIDDSKKARRVLGSTHLLGYLGNYTATDLERVFGPPLYRSKDSYDGKVKLEWNVEFNMFDDNDVEHRAYFTVYDWKNYDMSEEQLYNEYIEWHIGGRNVPGNVIDLIIEQFEYEVGD